MADTVADGTTRSQWRAALLLWAPGLAVAVGAGVVTAHGLYTVATAAGVPTGIAWLYPLITDGLALVAYAATHRLAGRGSCYAWVVVVLAAGLSGLAQATYLASGATIAASTTSRFGVGAWPAIAAAVAAHLLYLLGAAVVKPSSAQDTAPVRSPFATDLFPADGQHERDDVDPTPIKASGRRPAASAHRSRAQPLSLREPSNAEPRPPPLPHTP